MTSSETRTPRYSRRIFWLAVFVAVLFGGYSLVWFYVADKLQTQATAVLAEVNAKGVTVECANPTARGFPFRIGLYCDSTRFDDRKGTMVSAGAFRSAAQIYNPYHIVGELDGPGNVAAPGAGALSLNWSELRGSVRLATPLPQRVSIEGSDLAAGISGGSPLVNAKAFQAHLRPNGADLDIAGGLDGLSLAAELVQGRTMPPLSGALDATVNQGVNLLLTRVRSLRGQSGTIRQFSISTDADTGIDLKGPFSIDDNGVIDADLTLTLRNPRGLATAASTAAPEMKDKIDQAMIAIGMLGSKPSLPLKIANGKAMLGFIPLGAVPTIQ